MSQDQQNNITLDITKDGHTARKFVCPSCRKKRFVRFYDFAKGEYLPEDYGRCDRQENCGYYNNPLQDDTWKEQHRPTNSPTRSQHYSNNKPAKPQPKQVEKGIVNRTLKAADYKNNIFAVWLRGLIGPDLTNKALKQFFIGNARNGATIFWQVDQFMRVRTGQRILYRNDGHRDKSQHPARLFTTSEGYKPCLFGEHQLYTISNKLPVAIVESEKTAVICSVYFPTINGQPVLWMASGGVNGLTQEKIEVLRNKNIYLVPDFSYHARATWGAVPMRKKPNDKGVLIPHPEGEFQPDFVSEAQKLRNINCSVKVLNLRKNINDGSDIADELIKRKPPTQYTQPNYQELILTGPNYQTPKNAIKALGLKKMQSFKVPEPTIINSLAGEVPFRLIKDDDNNITEILISSDQHKGKLQQFLKKPQIQNLIEKLSIFEGTIEIGKNEF